MVEMAELPEIAIRAEQLGFEGLVLGDHLLSHKVPHSLGGDHRVTWGDEVPWPDVWVQIAALSGMTRRLKFMTGVYVLPLRDPFTVAKSISTTAIVSGNRLITGIGVGWERREFEAVGLCFEDRGGRADEMLVVIKKLLSGTSVSHAGRFYRFADVRMSPRPDTIPPVYCGGLSEAALRRAAGNDGWIGGLLTVDELAPLLRGINEHRARLGRAQAPFETVTALRHFDEEKAGLAASLGISAIINPAWINAEGLREHIPLERKINDMRVFAQRFIH